MERLMPDPKKLAHDLCGPAPRIYRNEFWYHSKSWKAARAVGHW